MSKVTSRPLTDEHIALLQECRDEVASDFGLKTASLTPEQIQQWIMETIYKLQQSTEDIDTKLSRSFALAIVWGDTLIKTMGWHWLLVQDEDGNEVFGVASPNRSHVVPVTAYFSRLVSDPKADNTTLLLYNMIHAGDLTPAPADALYLMS